MVDTRDYSLRCVQPRYGSWVPGTNEAKCLARYDWYGKNEFNPPEPDHQSPYEGCQCGLHGWDSMEKVDKSSYRQGGDFVAAAILGWGTVIEHSKGWRSQYARVIALSHASARGLSTIAEKYNIPLIQYDYLESFGGELGITLKDQKLGQYEQLLAEDIPSNWGRPRISITSSRRTLQSTAYSGHSGGRYTKIKTYTDGSTETLIVSCPPTCQCTSLVGQLKSLFGRSPDPRG